MMKSLKKNIVILMVTVIAMVIFATRVNAAGSLSILPTNTAGDNTTNTTTNVTSNVTQLNVAANNVVKVNTVNDASKDLPKTGENDVYIISAIGLVAIVVGLIAYIKSRNFDIR